MMINLNRIANVYEEKLQKCQEYIDALAEERRKIQVFQRELPLCLQLVTQAIEACKHQLTSGGNEYNFHGQSECSEQTSSDEGPVLEEFIPIKRLFSSSHDDDQQYKKIKSNNNDIDTKNNVNKASDNSDWLRSAQLWNQSPDPNPKEASPKVVQVVEVKRDVSGGAFNLFKGEKSEGNAQGTDGGDGKEVVAAATAAAASSSAETGESSGGLSDKTKKQGKEGQSLRKQRRSWSPELHKKFLDALQQLGGSHVATPKQIKELMSVDGLTNDEVKSHLQKYRLHTRRPNLSNNNSNSPQKSPPQFVVVGGLWVPPPEYNATASAAQTIATITNVEDASKSLKQGQFLKKPVSDDRGSHCEGGVPSHSPVTSSSDITTASPPPIRCTLII